MADYYIQTAAGQKGPYPEEKIIEGMRQGKVPTGAKLLHAMTGAVIRAVDLTAQAPRPASTSPADSGGYTPTEPYRAQGQQAQARPVTRQPGPNQQPAYPQGPQYGQPQYGQPQYPQQPYGQPQYGQYQQPYPQANQPYGAQQYGAYPQAPQTSTYAILSLVMSLATIIASCLPLWILGIIFGVMALKECAPNGPRKGRGLALAGIWTGVGIGALSLLLLLVILADG